jgi:hypothetical protein
VEEEVIPAVRRLHSYTLGNAKDYVQICIDAEDCHQIKASKKKE